MELQQELRIAARVRLVKWLGEAKDIEDPASDPACLEIIEVDEVGNRVQVYRKPVGDQCPT